MKSTQITINAINKCRLKKTSSPIVHGDMDTTHVPDDINDSDWQFLVDYFSSPYFEVY